MKTKTTTTTLTTTSLKEKKRQVLVAVHAFNPSTQGGSGRWISEFEASLVYKVSSRPCHNTTTPQQKHKKTNHQKKKKKKTTKKKKKKKEKDLESRQARSMTSGC